VTKDQQDHKVTKDRKVHLVQDLKEIKDLKATKGLMVDLVLDHKATKDLKVTKDHQEHLVRWVLMVQKDQVVDKDHKDHKDHKVTLASQVILDLLE
jgi:hypothetical protein